MPEQIALIELPVRDITGRRSHRLVAEAGEMDVRGQRFRVMTSGRHLEFRLGARRFEIDLEDLTAAAAITGHLKAEIVARTRASRSADRAFEDADRAIEGDGFVTLHPSTRRPVEPLP